MKARMTIASQSIAAITPYPAGGGTIGHSFTLLARLQVAARTFGAFSGEGITTPQLEWKENIVWYDYNRTSNSWMYAGNNRKDMYAFNPNSQTFAAWHSFKYRIASSATGASASMKSAGEDEKDLKHWIAKNGFTWDVPITDRPGMGIAGGSGGGGGASLVTGDTRRRIIYFDLGFSGTPFRNRCVQILETFEGKVQIWKFVRQHISEQEIDGYLEDWRAEYRNGILDNYAP